MACQFVGARLGRFEGRRKFSKSGLPGHHGDGTWTSGVKEKNNDRLIAERPGSRKKKRLGQTRKMWGLASRGASQGERFPF